ncbi:MAG: sulfite exporter TauE/SafE family protein [Candidatus Rokuibacteriota bacterium]
MPDPIGWAVLIAGAVLGSLVGGVAGFGAGIIMLPLVAWVLGVRATVPVLTVTMAIGNVARIWWSRGEVDRGVVVRFALGAIPATALGTAIYVGTPAEWFGRFVGVFLIASVPLRRILSTDFFRMRLRHFPALGAVVGLLSGLVVTTGPLNTPFFLAYGLRRGAYVGTESVCAMVMHLSRGAALARYALLTRETFAVGAVLGLTMFAGSWFGRRLLDRMSDRVFLGIVEVLLVLMGLHSLLFPR